MDLFLIRHPPVAVVPGVCYGASDVALAGPLGPTLRHLRRHLPAARTVFSSPLSRCLRLAERLGPVQVDARLRELDFGEWELLPFDALGPAALEHWAADPFGHRPPGGETGHELAARTLAFLHALRDTPPAATPVVVTHGGPLRVMLGHLLDMPPARWLDLEVAHGRLCRLALGEHGARLQAFNL